MSFEIGKRRHRLNEIWDKLATVILLAAYLVVSLPSQAQSPKASFKFMGESYFHRFTKGDLSEFTPSGQADLKKWQDMITVNRYPDAKDGEALARAANAVLETYKQNGATIVRTDSIPRTTSKPAEHLIVALFKRPEFTETAFARFLMTPKVGASIVYSRRFYGEKSGNQMGDWLTKNGEKTEKALMAMSSVPRN